MNLAKEKAKELVHRYDLLQTHVEGFSFFNAKECALITVNEILKELFDNKGSNERIEYFYQVKQEITNL